jgi:serine/threonine protein phosphatase PrpC
MSHICVSGSVVGPSHLRSGRPCEDSLAICESGDGWVAAVVCDGCGSVGHAREGATFVSENVAKGLAALGPKIATRGFGEWVSGPIVKLFAQMRDDMRARFQGDIGDYAATIVGALVSRDHGLLVHIGDGIGSSFALSAGADDVAFEPQDQSEPENSEHDSNATYYVTDPGWLRHLRIQPVFNPECLILCTDGAQSLLYERNTLSQRALSWLLREIAHSPDAASRRLEAFLQDPEAAKRSDDDKTVVLLFSQAAWSKLTGRADAPLAAVPRRPVLALQPRERTQAAPSVLRPPPTVDRGALLTAELKRTHALLTRTRRRLWTERTVTLVLGWLVATVVLAFAGILPVPYFPAAAKLRALVCAEPPATAPEKRAAPPTPSCGSEGQPECPK